jgi:hypothetical protein
MIEDNAANSTQVETESRQNLPSTPTYIRLADILRELHCDFCNERLTKPAEVFEISPRSIEGFNSERAQSFIGDSDGKWFASQTCAPFDQRSVPRDGLPSAPSSGHTVHRSLPVLEGGEQLSYVILLIGLSTGQATREDGRYVKTYDPSGNRGQGLLTTTEDSEDALQFGTETEAFEKWREPYGIRADGKPNRPLTAFTMTLERVGERKTDTEAVKELLPLITRRRNRKG